MATGKKLISTIDISGFAVFRTKNMGAYEIINPIVKSELER